MQNNLLAQYEGTTGPGQVLGTSSSTGIPSWVLVLILLLLGFVILFFAWRRYKKH